jgi:hypothetical protein
MSGRRMPATVAVASLAAFNTGLRLVLFLLLIIGLGSLAAGVQLLRAGAPGGKVFPITWLLLAIAALSLVSAWGIWRHRRWARYAFLAWAVLNVVWEWTMAFALAALGGAGILWLLAGVMALGALALAGVLVLFVWRRPAPART